MVLFLTLAIVHSPLFTSTPKLPSRVSTAGFRTHQGYQQDGFFYLRKSEILIAALIGCTQFIVVDYPANRRHVSFQT